MSYNCGRCGRYMDLDLRHQKIDDHWVCLECFLAPEEGEKPWR